MPILFILFTLQILLQDNYDERTLMSYPRLQQDIKAAWEAVPVEYLEDLLSSMQQRCQWNAYSILD